MKSITELGDISGKKILLRLDFNVSVRDGVVVNDFRIRRSMATIQILKERGAIVIILSHIEKKEGGTLEPVFLVLQKNIEVGFVKDFLSDEGRNQIKDAKSGEVLLCENLRKHKGEETNEEGFSKKLAELGDVFVNEAFSTSHRPHASIVSLPKLLPSFVGPLFQDEVTHMDSLKEPKRPFLFIIGGAKFDTKIPMIKSFLEKADNIFILGALAHVFLRARGFEIGESLVSDVEFDIFEYFSDGKILLPDDVEVLSNDKVSIKKIGDVLSDDIIMDVGQKTMKTLSILVKSAKTILWNGSLGNYEKGFGRGTRNLAKIISESNAKSIVGGGDTTIAITELGIEKNFTFVSTAGGAMIDYLLDGTLPGIEAFKNSKSN